MKSYTINATERKHSLNAKQLVLSGMVAANVYGKHFPSKSLTIKMSEFLPLYKEAGETGLVELYVADQVYPVLIHHVQRHAVNGRVLHVEFYKVDLKEKVKANVPIVISDEAPAVTEKKGVLLTLISEIEIEALPAELPEQISVSASTLVDVDNEINVGDLKVPQGVSVHTDPDVVIAKIAPLVSKEAEEQAAQEAAAQAEDTQTEQTSAAQETPSEPVQEKAE